MRAFTILLIIIGIGTGIGFAVYEPVAKAIADRNRPKWRTEEVIEGNLELFVNATGTVEPVKRVTVGAVVSGPVSELFVDFNSKIVKGQLMARIDPSLFEASVKRDNAVMKTRRAEIERAKARLQQAINNEQRSAELARKDLGFVSQSEMDDLKFSRMAAEADVTVAEANLAQAKAQLENSQANLEYTEVKSPVDGIVIDRKIDSGQTLAAQFQTPEMFVVAPEMDQRMFIYASIDEADIGLIRQAQDADKPVEFTVDAYPDELFDNGRIQQVRLSSTTEQNVVTYPVVVETPNPDLKLLPGMTASLSFAVDSRVGVTKIPNSAIRFYPDRQHVHPDDHDILDGTAEVLKEANDKTIQTSAATRADKTRRRNQRHVWVQQGDLLRAKYVELGATDSRYTELIDGEINPGDQLVVGAQLDT